MEKQIIGGIKSKVQSMINLVKLKEKGFQIAHKMQQKIYSIHNFFFF
ncbi:hypothetical protein EV05_0517 [Prochlorococcus sp. MIT 0601]|nr:hypothetical protein EV05_0517 [Prochlorococcus sp. MIT 0601]